MKNLLGITISNHHLSVCNILLTLLFPDAFYRMSEIIHTKFILSFIVFLFCSLFFYLLVAVLYQIQLYHIRITVLKTRPLYSRQSHIELWTVLFFSIVRDRVSLCHPDCLRTLSADQAGLKFTDQPAFNS